MSKRPTTKRDPVLDREPGERCLMLGNEAIVRGALEAGVGAATTYPGTPSSEIGDTFARLAERAGVFFEYATNEKVALEVAAATSLSGVRSIVSVKHVGLNVALEALVPLGYTGVPGGLVVVSAGDPSCHSSLTEQDNRHLVRLASLPCIEPSTPEEARVWTRRAFELSEALEIPVILRTTTRVSHMRGVVRVGSRVRPPVPRGFTKDPTRFVTIPPVSLQRHQILLDQLETFEAKAAELGAAIVTGSTRVGVVSSGAPRNYVKDALDELSLQDDVRHLELILTHPLPRADVVDFLASVDRVLVVEELDPVLEHDLLRIAAQERLDVDIVGKSVGRFSRVGEYDPGMVQESIAAFVGIDGPAVVAGPSAAPRIPTRPPALCAGCPHRASYYALQSAVGKDAIFAGDIGCYTLGALPPFQAQDTVLCMGASTGLANGFAAVNDRPVVAVIGDSTFFHAGIPGLIDAIRHGRDVTIAVLDNRTTAMTGHQPHPGTDHETAGEMLSVEAVATGLGVQKVEVVNPMSLPHITQKARECVEHEGVAVLVCREPCPLYERKVHDDGERVVYRVDRDRCKRCGFDTQGLHCGAEICHGTERWRSEKKIEQLGKLGENPIRMQVPPCGESCPVNICVHGYVANVAAGDYAAALQTIRQRNPLPSVCSRVCHAPCEIACIREGIDEPIAINDLKRFVCDWASDHSEEIDIAAPSAQHDERVAVVGSGPAGLACAHDLAQRGYQVTVFDQMDEPGGLLRYGIPPYRLPSDVLDRDVDWIRRLGVEFRLGVSVGADVEFAHLVDEYDAVCLATGAWKPRMPQELRHSDAARDALGFLRQVNRVADPAHDLDSRKVVIVGAGNTGVDAARVALRLGASRVTVVERTDRDGCAAIPSELTAAELEGVSLRFESNVVALRKNDAGSIVEIVNPKGSEELHADMVLVAVGQELSDGSPGAEVAENGWIHVEGDDGHTRIPGVFAVGDSVTGPGFVITAIADGKRAAFGIDTYLADDRREVEPLAFHDPGRYADEPTYEPVARQRRPRIEGARQPALDAIGNFGPVERTFTEEQARAEADRCFACGACANCNVCIDMFACVALYEENGQIRVDEDLCNGCGVCAELCPNNAFTRVVL